MYLHNKNLCATFGSMGISKEIENERLQFGTRPKTFTQALVRLPDHGVFVRGDTELESLMSLRFQLTYALKMGCSADSLTERMYPLEPKEMALLEKFSFKRNEVIATGKWIALGRNKVWNTMFGSEDDDYRHYNVTSITPTLDRKRPQMICIQEHDDYSKTSWDWETDAISTFYIGIITSKELSELKKALQEEI